MVAAKLRMKDRGLLRKGYHADLAVFDPENVRENTTYRDPVRYPTGFDAVIVNGRERRERAGIGACSDSSHLSQGLAEHGLSAVFARSSRRRRFPRCSWDNERP